MSNQKDAERKQTERAFNEMLTEAELDELRRLSNEAIDYALKAFRDLPKSPPPGDKERPRK